MRNLFILLLGLMVLAGCSKTSVEPELTSVSNAAEISLLESVSECKVMFSPWVRPGTAFRTMQVCLAWTLSSPVTIHFRAFPKNSGGMLPGGQILIVPVTLLPGERYAEVPLLPFLPEMGHQEMDENDNLIFVYEKSKSYEISIGSIDYNGPESVVKDDSKWSVKPTSYDFHLYGYEISRVRGS